MADGIRLTVAFALAPGLEDLSYVTLRQGATLDQALAASGLAARHPGVDFNNARLGIWGRGATANALVGDGDRIEIYRPLVVDPKVARVRRAAKRQQTIPHP